MNKKGQGDYFFLVPMLIILGIGILIAIILCCNCLDTEDIKEEFCKDNGYEGYEWYDGDPHCVRKEGSTKTLSQIDVDGDKVYFVEFNGNPTAGANYNETN